MYATSENRTWTAKDERDLKSDHKRVTRATLQHLGKLSMEQDRTFLDKLLRRQTPDAELPLNKRPLPPKAPSDNHWWNRSIERSSPRTPTQDSQPEVRRAVTVTGNTRTAPPIPPRYDLMQTSPPQRLRRKSEHSSAARQRARETALRHLETERGYRHHVRDNRGYVPPPLKPGTWIPGQLNAVPLDDHSDDCDYDFIDEYGFVTTPELCEQFPIPPTQPLKIVPRQREEGLNNVSISPIPQMPDRSNRESFLELRKKRSYRV